MQDVCSLVCAWQLRICVVKTNASSQCVTVICVTCQSLWSLLVNLEEIFHLFC